MKKILPLLLLIFLSSESAAWPWSGNKKEEADSIKKKDSLELAQWNQLKLEIAELSKIRSQKADELEKLETTHWKKRYAEAEMAEEHNAKTRELDARYTKLSTDLGRLTEETIAENTLAENEEEKANETERAYEALNTQIKLSIEKSLSDIAGDYPVKMNERLLNLKTAESEFEKKSPNTIAALRLFFDDELQRLRATYTAFYGRERVQMGNRPDVLSTRLRLGTIFLADIAEDEVQLLYRSGTLQGKMFEWNNDVSKETAKRLRAANEEFFSGIVRRAELLQESPAEFKENSLEKQSAEKSFSDLKPSENLDPSFVSNLSDNTSKNSRDPSENLAGENFPEENKTLAKKEAQNASPSSPSIFLPLDVLQSKTARKSLFDEGNLTLKEKAKAFFKKGGVVMYPLLLVALFSLLLCLERFFTLSLRGKIDRNWIKKIHAFAEENRFTEAKALCSKKKTSLSTVLYAILLNADDEELAEKSLEEAMLREQPKLERRMGLLSAMGSIAPLLGLLGTVTGIITLFNVITEAGTNDARILAGGISEALVTTETGLIIAIPVMILHGLLSEKIEKTESELFSQSASLLNKIFSRKKNQSGGVKS